ncbi:type VI immunity family protein [Janthinobacterium sp. LB3P118]|uniref:type VI immunity family protein n=1 Tax=Janthinobacterium sp. LB3P118 TaxID=3424195 RepID=UPI003F216416
MGGWWLCGLRFSPPILFSEENPGLFQELFVSFARRLCAVHGYGGYSLILATSRCDENQTFETFLTSKFKGFDAGHLVTGSATADLGVKTVSWLSAIDNDYVEKVGGISTIRSELPMDWFGKFDYGAGLVIQGGPQPDAAPSDLPTPARLVLPNLLLKPIRTTKTRMHFASGGIDPRLIGAAADEWMKRFDVEDDELMAYKAKLLDEPKFTELPRHPTRR